MRYINPRFTYLLTYLLTNFVIMAAFTIARTSHYVLQMMFVFQRVISEVPRLIANKLSHVRK